MKNVALLAATVLSASTAVLAAVPVYYQCGGNNWTGETECVEGAVCVFQNEWYSQCLPGTATETTTKTSTSSTKTSSSSTKTSSSSTKTSSTKTSSSSTKTSTSSTKTSSTGGGGGPTPTGLTTTLPPSAGYTSFATASVISGSFDGGMKRFDRKGSSGDCQGQSETGEEDAVFILESGASLSNVIIGAAQAEGVHCRGPCTVRNVWWADVCEDAITIKQTGSGDVSYIIGGGTFSAEDKIVQHNGAGRVVIQNFFASNFGKLYRSCGNCSKSYARHVTLDNVAMKGGKEGVGINTNFGDTASISRVCTDGKPTAVNVCCRYKGVGSGSEPSKIGCGPDSSCSYSTSSITTC